MVSDRLWYYTDSVVSDCPFSGTGPASNKWGSCRLGGIVCMFMCDWSALMAPQKAALDSLRTLS